MSLICKDLDVYSGRETGFKYDKRVETVGSCRIRPTRAFAGMMFEVRMTVLHASLPSHDLQLLPLDARILNPLFVDEGNAASGQLSVGRQLG